ncbi:MAG: peptidoglycan DD-metalloendopeptidase family protein [Aeromonas sp.]
MRGCNVISQKTSRVGLLAGALFFCLLGSATDAMATTAQLGNMQNQIQAQKKTITYSRRELAKLNSQLRTDEIAISAAAAKLEQTKQLLEQSQQTLVRLQQDKQELEQQAAHQQRLLAKQAESAFIAGKHDYLKLLLNQQDPAKVSRSLDYYDYLNKARIAAIDTLRATRDKLAQNQLATQETEAQLQILLTEQKEHHQTLLASQQSRAKVRNKLQQAVQNGEQQLTQMVNTERSLKAQLERLRRQREQQERRERAEQERDDQAEQTRLTELNTEQRRQHRQEMQRLADEQQRLAVQQRIAEQQQEVGEQRRLAAEQQRIAKQQKAAQQAAEQAPLPRKSKRRIGNYGGLKGNTRLSWPVKGPILIPYGSPRTAQLKWKGTLIGAREGAQVKAVAPGQVVYANWLDGFGMLLVIDHGKGYMSLYGHNQSLLRRVGQNVEQGEPVALVGDSGGLDKSGLYFEIRHQGEAINPAKLLR